MARHSVLLTILMMAAPAAIGTFAQGASIGPAANTTMIAKKAAMRPPVGAKPATSVGKDKLVVSTANSPSDQDSFWIERIDIDGDGDVEESHLLWDDEDKVLYAFSSGRFACRNGGTATFDLLVAGYGPGNSHKKPAGSGFWVADLDKGECGVQTAGLWGCRFDAGGTPTACGAATLDQKNDDLVIVSEKKEKK